jgi:hypothetical protein
MEIKSLLTKPSYSQDKRLTEEFDSFQKLINELKKRDIPVEIATSLNEDIDEINQFNGSAKDTVRLLKKRQSQMATLLEKELKLVTINYHRNRWLALGMSAFGLPIGVAFGLSMGNLGLLGIGLPIGMGIGVLVGTSMDKKAKESGKQLDVELKY